MGLCLSVHICMFVSLSVCVYMCVCLCTHAYMHAYFLPMCGNLPHVREYLRVLVQWNLSIKDTLGP